LTARANSNTLAFRPAFHPIFWLSGHPKSREMTLTPGQSQPSGRTRAILPSLLSKKLAWYTAAAAAVGAGLVCGTRSAEAEVVYTPTNTPLTRNVPVDLDLNNDGVADFELINQYTHTTQTSCFGGCNIRANLHAIPSVPGNSVWAVSSAPTTSNLGLCPFGFQEKKNSNGKTAVAVAAPWGVLVAEQRKFASHKVPLDFFKSCQGIDAGSMVSVGAFGKNKPFTGPYLGFKYKINGETHYGWARVEVRASRSEITATLTGYAYETVANRPIVTGLTEEIFDQDAETPKAQTTMPEPVSLGRLAQGSSGIAWRIAGALR
jgi:hypothetical protein